MPLLPYEPRPFQAEAVELVRQAAEAGNDLVFEAGTGTGKTVVLLAGALEATVAAGRRLLYVTRTNSQQEQAIRELAVIRERSGLPLKGVALQGRAQLCFKLEDEDDPDLGHASPEELSHFCSYAKRVTESEPSSPKACRHYAGLLTLDRQTLADRVGASPVTAEALKALGRKNGFCSYEATKKLLPEADVVVAPYVFAFDPGLRTRLFQWWGVRPEEVVLLVDEAHNLPSYLREMSSPRLGKETLRRALSESEALGHPMVARSVGLRPLIEATADALERIVAEFAQEEDGFVPPYELEMDLLGRFHIPSGTLLQACEATAQLGETIKDRRRLLGKVPRSALSTLAAFLQRWLTADESEFVKIAVREPRPLLEAFCVDATVPARALQEFHATIHASGTLNPLVEYRDALGLDESTRLERFPSPFDPSRLRIGVVRDLTTRYERMREDPSLVDRLQEATKGFLEQCKVNAAVFFPSHQLMEEFDEVGVLRPAGAQVLKEARGLSQEALMGLVKSHRTAVGRSHLVGVSGGRLSEGLDFPGAQLEALLVVGVPFPKPTARQRSLFRYYEARHGRGWDYAIKAPAVRRLRQTLGRLIRGPEDRGYAFVLDERAAPLLEGEGLEVSLAELGDLFAEFQAWQDGRNG